MSLKDKLKPASKQPGVGKVAPCPKCGRDAEHYGPNYVHCFRCDEPKPKAEVAVDPFDADHDTNPGFGTPLPPHGMALYMCASCGCLDNYYPADVATGLLCQRKSLTVFGFCLGFLRRVP